MVILLPILIYIFTCPAYYHVREIKLDSKAKKAIFLGFNIGAKRYRLWCLESEKIIYSRDVTFYKSSILKGQNKIPRGDSNHTSVPQQVEFETSILKEQDRSKVFIEDDTVTGDVLEIDRKRIIRLLQSVDPEHIKSLVSFTHMVAYTLPIVEDDVSTTYQEAKVNGEAED